MASTTASGAYKLYFFRLRGIAEYIRYMFAYANLPFEDCTFTWEEWLHGDIQKTTPMPSGCVPTLILPDGRALGDSIAIGRYLAEEFGMSGKDRYEAAFAHMIVQRIGDLLHDMTPIYMAHFENRLDDKAKEWTKFKESQLKDAFQLFTDYLRKSETGFICGGPKPTWADLRLAEYLNSLDTFYEPGILKQYETLKRFHDLIHVIPPIQVHVDRRPETIL